MISYPNNSDAITPLWVRSGYSLMRGPVALDRLVAAAAGMGRRRLALTDVNNLYGATFFWKQACEKGIEPIIGAELVDGDMTVVALVENQAGYENLCQIITRIHDRAEGGIRHSASGIREDKGATAKPSFGAAVPDGGNCGMRSAECGIHSSQAQCETDVCHNSTSYSADRQAHPCTQQESDAGLPVGDVCEHPDTNGRQSAIGGDRTCDSPNDASESDSAFRTPHSALKDVVSLQDGLHFLTDQDAMAEALLAAGVSALRVWLAVDPATQTHRQLGRLIECSHRRGVPLVACGTTMMVASEDWEVARLLAAIRTGTTFDNVKDSELPHPRALLRSDEQLRREIGQSQELSFAGNAHGKHIVGVGHNVDGSGANAHGKRSVGIGPSTLDNDEHAMGDVSLGAQAIANNVALAWRCAQFKLLPRSPVFPDFDMPDGLSAGQYLRQLCEEGVWRRYSGDPPPGCEARLEMELDRIVRRGFAEYFLVVWDIVQYARRQGAPVAGRGSGASSLVAYLLGITNVCPLAFEIPFERFLNEYRTDFPDLDVDFCWRIRDDVINYAFRRWGNSHVGMVSMHTAFQERSAVRETAKALGMSSDQVSRMEEDGIRHSGFGIREDKEIGMRSAECGIPAAHGGAVNAESRIQNAVTSESPADARQRNSAFRTAHSAFSLSQRIAYFAKKILGLPHVISVHPGGIVIGRKPIDHYVPVQTAAKGVRIVQFDKNGVEDINLVKLDLLGNRNLSTIRYATDLIRRRHGVSIDTESLGPDEATIRTLQRAQTIGCNQLESPAMRHLLRMMQPTGPQDVMKVLALIRPGAASIGMKEVFIRRHRGLEPVPGDDDCELSIAGKTTTATEDSEKSEKTHRSHYLSETSVFSVAGCSSDVAILSDPSLTPEQKVRRLLRGSYGVMLYEDDVMLVAAALLGKSLDEADRFRKAVQKCHDDRARLALSRQFLDACEANGVEAAFARDMWVQMAKYNAYSFCRAHAASYAVLAYAGAYLKTHYPLEFWVACLNNNQSMYPPRCYIEEAKRQGVEFLLPCVNRSGEEYTLEENSGELVIRHSGFGIREDTTGMSNAECRMPDAGSIRVGLGCVGGLGPVSVKKIIDERTAGGAFTGLSNFLSRTRIGREEARSLILCGAFDFTGRRRPALMLELELFLSSRMGRMGPGRTLLSVDPTVPVVPGDYEPLRKYMDERRILGLSAREHLMAIYRPLLAKDWGLVAETKKNQSPRPAVRGSDQIEPIDSRGIESRVDRRVRLSGVLEAYRSNMTQNGERMLFLTMDDEFGLFEVTVFPDAMRRVEPLLGSDPPYGPYVIEGTVEDQYGAITVCAQRVELYQATVEANT